MEERKDIRRTAELAAALHSGRGEASSVAVSDISRSGCKVATGRNLHVGTFVRLTLGGFPAIEGWVAWSAPKEAGIDFAHPLGGDLLRALSGSWG